MAFYGWEPRELRKWKRREFYRRVWERIKRAVSR